jgi:hypothetical protein
MRTTRAYRAGPFVARSIAATAVVAASVAVSTVPADSLPTAHADEVAQPLPLGPAGLPESRTTTELAPGVTLTHIVRGAPDAGTPWVVEVSIPSTTSSPDPDAPPRSVQDRASAEAIARRLTESGLRAEAQTVEQPAVADVPAGVIGYRVRLTEQFPTQTAAQGAASKVQAAGYSARTWYSGWDGGSSVSGQWTVNVLTVDPRPFRGRLGATFGPDLENRETTTALSRWSGAVAAVNGGFFVLDPASGAPGDPAGAGVYDGLLESETVGQRPVLALDRNGRHTQVVRPEWRGSLRTELEQLPLDGLNRVPGLIRNCGGDATDTPTQLPLHDVTCRDADELVAFSTAFGPTTPAGPGAEVVLDRTGRVVSVSPNRGVALAPGQQSVQGIGALAEKVAALKPGQHVGLDLRLTSSEGGNLVRPGTSLVNGGPQLLSDGAVHITQAQDGMVHPGDPSFAYGWVLQRNPRTFAGVDQQGRTLLVTVDGRQPDQLGLSIPETAAVAQALGLDDALNLDGGGSTAMAVRGQLTNQPSDATGERPVGDAIYVG